MVAKNVELFVFLFLFTNIIHIGNIKIVLYAIIMTRRCNKRHDFSFL